MVDVINTVIKYILIIAALMVRCQASAQENYYVENPSTFYGGLVAGTNLDQVDGDDYAGYDKVGYNFGGIVYAKFSKSWGASMEILYSQKGSRGNYPVPLTSGFGILNYGVNLNYAEVPVLINLFDKHKSHIGVGVSYSRLATSSEHITTIPAQYIDFSKYPFKKSDYNIIAAANLHLWKGLFLNLRFQYSLFSIRDNLPLQYEADGQYNNLIVLRLMYLFM